MARAPTDLRSLARAHTHMGLKVLAGIAQNSTNDSARVAAVALLLDRGWGKAPQPHAGVDGEGEKIQVTIRHIVDTSRVDAANKQQSERLLIMPPQPPQKLG
jgi:hypothetical protein